jgi:hypothetical protein
MDGSVASAEVKRVHTLPPGERTMLISEDVDTVQLRDDHAAKLRAAARPAERTIPSADRPVAMQPTVERGRTAQQTEPAEPTGAARSMGNPVPADGAVASTEVKGEYTRPYERLTPASEDAGSVRVTDDRAVAELDRPATMQPAVEKGRTAQPAEDPKPADRVIAPPETQRVHTPVPRERTAPVSEDADDIHLRDDHAAKERAMPQSAEVNGNAVRSASRMRTEPRRGGTMTPSRVVTSSRDWPDELIRSALVESLARQRNASQREHAQEEPAQQDAWDKHDIATGGAASRRESAPADRIESARAASVQPTGPAEGPGASQAMQASEPGLTEQAGSSVMRQIAAHVSARAAQGGGEFRTRLVPEHLGSVEIRIRVARGACTATIRADDAEVAKYIESHGADLKVSLEEHGIELASLSVSPRSRAEEGWSAMTPTQSGSSSSDPDWNGANARQQYAAAAFAGSHFGQGGGGRRGALMERGLGIENSHSAMRDSDSPNLGEPGAAQWARGYARIDYLA